ncbi:hypothetical protein PanWU01x14_299980 [Parasponia andersonii]|uniref:Uncharacterized protein n=1 Tax=Parasponia andersonii TaxID=3476 RepID=A0A2P5AU63_PARAD|nr:hypothetical protein PanWU01x14_299980 [Parasponia andersonii]
MWDLGHYNLPISTSGMLWEDHGADPIYTHVGLRRLPQVEIVVNVDPAQRGYLWAIECGPPNENARPLTKGDCNTPSPTSSMLWEDYGYLSGGP